jgi:excisionase family DNA binding protein
MMTTTRAPGTNPERLLTSAEVADLLQVGPDWVERRARRGHIPSIRVGKFVRFVWADVEQALRAPDLTSV